ncbi:MAG: NrpR regulatory domain-containing protein [Chloroflexota bacterium]
MIVQSAREVERKVISILRVLNDNPRPVGARIISRELKHHGVDLTERAVRYHLKFMDERGLTRPSGNDGRTITERGAEELRNALVTDKVGFVINHIEILAYRTTFDPNTTSGDIVINVSFFPRARFKDALRAMRPAFKAGLCVSELVAVTGEGERLGQALVPHGKVGFATVCSITTNGVLLKAGIPMGSRFGGILEIRDSRPHRFAELINYEGSTLDPSEIFISGRMTSVARAATSGEGKVLANFREIPAQCRETAQSAIAALEKAGIRGPIAMSGVSEPVCEIPVGLNRIGIVLLGGLNPVAAAEESGVGASSTAMAGVMEYKKLVSFWEL